MSKTMLKTLQIDPEAFHIDWEAPSGRRGVVIDAQDLMDLACDLQAAAVSMQQSCERLEGLAIRLGSACGIESGGER